MKQKRNNFHVENLMKFARGAEINSVAIPAAFFVEAKEGATPEIKATSGRYNGRTPAMAIVAAPRETPGEGDVISAIQAEVTELIKDTYGISLVIALVFVDADEAQSVWEITERD